MISKLSVTAKATLAALVVALFHSGAPAGTVTFGFSGAIVQYTVPVSGLYDVTGAGAQGGFTA